MLWKYTAQYLKNHKKQTILSLIFITSLVSLMLVVHLKTAYQHSIKVLDVEELHGTWQVYSNDISNPEKAKEYPHVLKYVVGKDQNDVSISFIEGDYETVLAYHFIEGRMPKTKEEIAISQYQLNQLGIKPNINEQIHLDFGTYTLVGITDYASGVEGFYPDYLVCPQDYQQVDLFLGGQKNLSFFEGEVYGKTFIYNLDNPTSSTGTIATNPYHFEVSQYFLYEIVMISMVAFILMMNYANASLVKRSHDYVLLRGIGALKRQLFTMSLIETTTLFVIAMIPGLLIAFGIALVLCRQHSGLEMSMLLSAGQVSLHVLICYLVVLSANSLPVFLAIQGALTGAFDHSDDRLFMRPIRKNMKLNAINLAKIQLKTHKKSSIFSVIIIVLWSTLALNLLSVHRETKEMTSHLDQMKVDTYIKTDHLEKFTEEKITNAGLLYQPLEVYQADIELPSDLSYYTLEETCVIPLTVETLAFIQDYGIVGKMPANHQEVLVSCLSLSSDSANFYIHGETIQINQEEYYISGAVNYHSLNIDNYYYSFFPIESGHHFFIFVLPEAIDDTFEHIQTLPLVKYQGTNIEDSEIKAAVNETLALFEHIKSLCFEREEKTLNYVLPASLVMFFMYFLGLIQHKGQYRDNIAVYKRIGMTKSEIRQIFLMEAVYFNGIGILLALFFSHFILAVPLDFYTIFFSLGIWLFLSIIYILPTLPSMNEKGENLWKSF